MFKALSLITMLCFLIFLTVLSCSSHRSKKIETLLQKSIILPSSEIKRIEFHYQLPTNGTFGLYLKANKGTLKQYNVTSAIRETCERERENINQPHSLGPNYNHVDKKNYDKHGKLTLQGKLLLENTRDYAVRDCINNFIYGKISLYLEDFNDSTYKYINKDIGKSLSTSRNMQQESYNLIQLNGTFGPFKKGTELKIIITTIVEKEQTYMSPPIEYELIAILVKSK